MLYISLSLSFSLPLRYFCITSLHLSLVIFHSLKGVNEKSVLIWWAQIYIFPWSVVIITPHFFLQKSAKKEPPAKFCGNKLKPYFAFKKSFQYYYISLSLSSSIYISKTHTLSISIFASNVICDAIIEIRIHRDVDKKFKENCLASLVLIILANCAKPNKTKPVLIP